MRLSSRTTTPMIHAYNNDALPTIQGKLASMFELAVLVRKIPVDDFAARFTTSPVCHALETADPVFALGKSANELLGLILGEAPLSVETDSFLARILAGLHARLYAVVFQQAV